MERIHFPVDRCVVCGAVVEEGRWVCAVCEARAAVPESKPVPSSGEKAPGKSWLFWRKKTKQ